MSEDGYVGQDNALNDAMVAEIRTTNLEAAGNEQSLLAITSTLKDKFISFFKSNCIQFQRKYTAKSSEILIAFSVLLLWIECYRNGEV